MTDITDQDRRVAYEWAASIDPEMDCWSASTRAVARIILATVDAPTPTIADEIMDLGRALDQYGHFDALGIDVAALADRVAQVEHDLTEASDEVERLTAVQKGAESNAETPNPADVKQGEAWIVECRGERRNAVKDNDDLNEPWNTVNADGWLLAEDDEDITLVSRLVPAPRVITNPDELEHLAATSIIRDSRGETFERTEDGWGRISIHVKAIRVPATVLWEPEA